jgi:hypothetical protein
MHHAAVAFCKHNYSQSHPTVLNALKEWITVAQIKTCAKTQV